MKQKNSKLTVILLAVAFCLFFNKSESQLPNAALVGYWHNYNDANAPYIALTDVDHRYNVIEVSFAVPGGGTDYQMEFTPSIAPATFISQIQTVQGQGRKVLISAGGAFAPISLDNVTEKNAFVSSMNAIIDQYGFDGMDIDFEGSSVSVSGGTVTAPTDAKILNLIDAIKQIMAHHRAMKATKLLLTMAPETVFVQGGMSSYGGAFGSYLPLIHGLRDSIDLLQVQLYNTGSMYGIDNGEYFQATADFIVAMTEAVIKGFNTVGGGTFTGLPANKIAIGLPACSGAAPAGGYTNPATVRAAMKYLMGTGPKPGSYTLQQAGGYPTLRGMMTWSINWDAVASCAGVNEYAANFQTIFAGSIALPLTLQSFTGTSGNTGNILKWITSAEVNTAIFVVEKSKDGISFYSSGNVPASNSNRTISYNYIDKDAGGTNYYRLKIIDNDGSFKYSSVISISAKYVYELIVYPNPVKDYVIIKANENMSDAVVRLTDINAKTVKLQAEVSGAEMKLNVSALPGGLYLLQVFNGGGEKRYQGKIVKE